MLPPRCYLVCRCPPSGPSAPTSAASPVTHRAALLTPRRPPCQTLIELAVGSVGPQSSPDDLRRLSAIIVVSLRALSTDLLHSNHVRSACEMLAARLAVLSPGSRPLDDKAGSLFLDFIAPVTSVLADILVAYPLPPATIRRTSHALLVVLWRWAPTLDQAGGFEALFEVGRTWWTLLDVLMSDFWSADERSTLLRELSQHAEETGESTLVVVQVASTRPDARADPDDADLARTNAMLVVAEQVIGGSTLDAILPVLSADVVPICNRYVAKCFTLRLLC